MELDHNDLARNAFGEDSMHEFVSLCRQSMHQLNNRLTTILANTQLTLLMLKDENLRRYLESVENAARDAGSIIRSFQESTQSISKSYAQTGLLDDEKTLIQK